ncbi:MAG: maleylpyruvate isomerase family mycothiol-dependent enzyme, partial [Acidimicrobiales bacterium]
MDSKDDMWDWVRAERRELAALLDALAPEQWRTPSLCEGWTIREVVGHLLTGPEIGTIEFLATFAGSRFDFHATMDKLARRISRGGPERLVADLRSIADDRWTPPGSGPEAPYTDLIVHGQDIRRPLGIDRELPEPGLTTILTKSITPRRRSVFPAGRFEGLRFEATDLAWTGGSDDGESLRGPAESLMRALWGRRVARDELEGPGVAILGRRRAA